MFTAVAGAAIAIALERWVDPEDSWTGMVFGVGLVEEAAKALGVWLFVTRLSTPAWSTRAYLFAGAVSGLAFGTAEAVTYSVAYERALTSDSTLYTGVLVWRLLSGGLLTPAWPASSRTSWVWPRTTARRGCCWSRSGCR